MDSASVSGKENTANMRPRHELKQISEILTLLANAIKSSADCGIQEHKKLMSALIERSQPLMDSQVKEYYLSCLNAIVSTFDSTYKNITEAGNTQLTRMVQKTRNKMAADILYQLDIFLIKYNNSIETISKQIKDMTNATDSDYCDRLNAIKLEEMTVEQVESEGERLKQEAIKNFWKLVHNIGVSGDWMIQELDQRLDEELAETVQKASENCRKAETCDKCPQFELLSRIKSQIEDLQKEQKLFLSERARWQEFIADFHAWRDALDAMLMKNSEQLRDHNLRTTHSIQLMEALISEATANTNYLQEHTNQLKLSMTELKEDLKKRIEENAQTAEQNFGRLEKLVKQLTNSKLGEGLEDSMCANWAGNATTHRKHGFSHVEEGTDADGAANALNGEDLEKARNGCGITQVSPAVIGKDLQKPNSVAAKVKGAKSIDLPGSALLMQQNKTLNLINGHSGRGKAPSDEKEKYVAKPSGETRVNKGFALQGKDSKPLEKAGFGSSSSPRRPISRRDVVPARRNTLPGRINETTQTTKITGVRPSSPYTPRAGPSVRPVPLTFCKVHQSPGTLKSRSVSTSAVYKRDSSEKN